MKTKGKIDRHVIRSAACAAFLSAVFVAPGSAVQSAKSQSEARAFSFAERVEYQRIIEDVYWRHRIWPKENPNPKPSLDAVMSQAQLQNKVAGYLRDSLALENYWQRPITAEQLQAEMDRMARDTRQPEVLRELFEALGNDAAVIAECLARPTLAERLIADLSAQDQTRHVESPQTYTLRAMSVVTTLGQVVYTLPKIADAGDPPCTDDTWTATSTTNAPSARYHHTAIWTGSEMIIWGGGDSSSPGGVTNTGGRYNPSTDSWMATSTTNAPCHRYGHTAIWTGSEMIVWGGNGVACHSNIGGRYNPNTDTWTTTSNTNAPAARVYHSAVWTGSEMIVWGGLVDNDVNTGGRYNPNTDTWTATTTINAPAAREGNTAVWTGSEMIVWGGGFNRGGRYNPSTDTWRATTTINAPSGRSGDTAVWTGSEMIVWGGNGNTGGRYFPSTNSWIATSTTNAPEGRADHTAVWTGTEMIVWGGAGGSGILDTGGRYNPNTNRWMATTTTNAPAARVYHSAVWTGSEMIVWGGGFNTGGRYCAPPPLTIIQPNGGEVWPAGSVHEIKWDSTNLKHTDHLILQYSRDGGASWFRIAQDIPAFTFGYWWQVDNFPTTQGRVKILLQENLSVTDQSDANFTVQRVGR
jgi:N-acetylneuraminic acid mutarotase